jgi:hypothetical protein
MMGAAMVAGWSGIALTYAAVQVPMVVGLIRARAAFHHFVLSPLVAAPLTAMTAAGMALGSWWLGHHGLVQAALGTGIGALLGYSAGAASGREGDDARIYQRGSVVADGTPSAAGKSRQRARDAGITLAGIPVPTHDETKHFKLIGTTGTGKSTAIEEILSGALARGDRAVIADPDGGYMRRFYRPERGDVVLNPFDERSVKWDLFAEIDSPYDIEQLARSLIPDNEGQDRSWRAYGRTFFTAVTRQAFQAGCKDVEELYRLLVVADTNELRDLVHGTPAQPFLDEHNSRMFDSIRSVTSSAVDALEYIGQQRGRDFSVRQWVGRGSPGVLFIPYKAGQIAALRAPISAWMRLAIFETMNQGEQPQPRSPDAEGRLWFVVDELDALGKIDGLKDALARLRKFDGRCVLGFQSISQVSSTYGPGEAHTIVENCGNTLALRCSASEGGGTARFASQLIGDREVLHTTVSKSRRDTELLGSVTRSQHLSREPAVLPSQIEQLPDLAGYLKFASDPNWQRVCLEPKRVSEQCRTAAPRHPHPGRAGGAFDMTASAIVRARGESAERE